MKRVHIIGRKNHGKTTLVSELVGEFQSRGLKVGTIKHTHHHHELDTPGKDSYLHRQAGASVVGIVSRSMNAVFWDQSNEDSAPENDRYAAFAPAFSSCDLVIVEGDVHTNALKLEVWRSVFDCPPMSDECSDVAVLITDDRPLNSVSVLARSDVASIADYIQRELRL